jgi:hypothetical protein
VPGRWIAWSCRWCPVASNMAEKSLSMMGKHSKMWKA